MSTAIRSAAALFLLVLTQPSYVVAQQRPRFDVAVGVGISRDGTGLSPARTASIPSFAAMLGLGDGLLGFGVGLLTTQALGRFRGQDQPVDRRSVEAIAMVRPFHPWFASNTSWAAGIPRSAVISVGAGYEQVSPGRITASRLGVRIGASMDLPLSSADRGKELRLRFAVRRFLGLTSARFEGQQDDIRDSQLELLLGLAVVF